MSRARLAAAALLLVAATALAQDATQAARAIDWDELAESHFDPKWILPEDRVAETENGDRGAFDLMAEMIRFAELEFPARRGEQPAHDTLSVGNLLANLSSLESDAARREYLDALKASRPHVHRGVRGVLPELVMHDRLHGSKWDPEDDESDDGLLVWPAVRRDVGGSDHFDDLSGDEALHQAATFILADTAAIKEAENDYSAYPRHVGADYEYIHAVCDSYVRGEDEDGRPFSALRLDFECDLPFPYTTYTCDLRILNLVDADGRLRTHIYSPSADFHWLAGQDLYVPVADSDGTFVGTLLVRIYGFDIDDVPDGAGARRTALRSSLGNLKRRAERIYAERGDGPRTQPALPAFPVRGLGPR